MPEMFRKSDPVLFILFLAAFIFLNILHLFTGYADNYDFVRNATFLFEKPYGFSAMVPQVGTEEWSRRFNTQWSDKWVFLADWPDMSNLINISSYKFYLLLQAKITYYLMGTPEYYFISFGSVVSRIILISSVVGIFFHLRNAMPFYAFWLFGIMSFIFFLDARWIGFLNSLYEEQMAVIFFPLIALSLLKNSQEKNVMLGVLLMLCATAVGTAKTAYFYFPLLMAFFVFPVFRGKFSVWKFALLVIACQGISFLPVYSGAYQQFNTYHAVYFGALDSISKDRSIEIEAIGEKPVLHECIGVVAYSSLGPDCIGRANASYGDVVQLVMSHPEVAASMVSRVFSEGKNIDISYLAKHSSELPSFSDLRIFNVVPYIFRYGLNYLVVVLLIISVVLLLGFRRYMNDVELAMMKTGMFFAMVAFSQYIASLADGFYEITKHMVIGNYSIGCSFVFLFPALVLTIATQIQRRN